MVWFGRNLIWRKLARKRMLTIFLITKKWKCYNIFWIIGSFGLCSFFVLQKFKVYRLGYSFWTCILYFVLKCFLFVCISQYPKYVLTNLLVDPYRTSDLVGESFKRINAYTMFKTRGPLFKQGIKLFTTWTIPVDSVVIILSILKHYDII